MKQYEITRVVMACRLRFQKADSSPTEIGTVVESRPTPFHSLRSGRERDDTNVSLVQFFSKKSG